MASESVYSSEIEGWQVSWESRGDYRLWCKQEHPSNSRQAAVVMFNPGSLSHDGKNLRKDTTLRVLRDVFLSTGYNPYVINLFPLATPRPWVLFDKWPSRDCEGFQVKELDLGRCDAVMYAYGAYELDPNHAASIIERIKEVRELFSGLDVPEISLPLAKTGTPKHPMRIQMEKLKEHCQQLIVEHAKTTHKL